MYSVGFVKPIKKGRAQSLLSRNLKVSEEDTHKTNSDIKHNIVKTTCSNSENMKLRWYREGAVHP